MAFPNLTDIVTTTIQNRSGKLADNTLRQNALLNYLNSKGNVKPFSGGNVILQELMYNDPTTQNAGSYSGYDVIDITPNSPLTSAQYDIKQYAAAVTISGLEQLQNAGKQQIIDLLEGRVMVAEKQLMNQISAGVYSDGTGNGGKNITGLAAAISTTPTTGTYGGINRATWTFWRNVAFSAATDGGAPASAANIQSYMNRTLLQTIRGSDSPDAAFADNNYYRFFLESMQAIQRVTDEKEATSGFAALAYYGAGKAMKVYCDGGIGGSAPANRMYFINSDYMFFRPHSERNMVPIGGQRQSVNQDAVVKLIGWAGNLTTSGAQFQAVLGA